MLHHIITFFFFFNDTATTEIYTLSLHDALPIWLALGETPTYLAPKRPRDRRQNAHRAAPACGRFIARMATGDRKSTRLNSSHSSISYAVFCLKKKKKKMKETTAHT